MTSNKQNGSHEEKFLLKGKACTKMDDVHYIARLPLKRVTPNKRNGFQ